MSRKINFQNWPSNSSCEKNILFTLTARISQCDRKAGVFIFQFFSFYSVNSTPKPALVKCITLSIAFVTRCCLVPNTSLYWLKSTVLDPFIFFPSFFIISTLFVWVSCLLPVMCNARMSNLIWWHFWWKFSFSILPWLFPWFSLFSALFISLSNFLT